MSMNLNIVINTYIQQKIKSICKDLDIEYDKSYEKFQVHVEKTKEVEDPPKQCMARIKNNGWGRQCSRRVRHNHSDYCLSHSRRVENGCYKWQQYGRIDEPAPSEFIEWYKKKGYDVGVPEKFFARDNISNLSKEEREQFELKV